MKEMKLVLLAVAIIASYSLSAQVAITTDGSSADGSAMLEIKSTDKGLLPPRMTQTQRDEISPVEGLIIYNTDTHQPNYYNGTIWKNYDGTSAQTLRVVGESYQGGIVAYILVSGDSGYDADFQHGLIAAPSDQSTGIQWSIGENYIVTGATDRIIGAGNANTELIIAAQGSGGYAAQLCADLELNGYDDWYLPSRDELDELYENKDAIGNFNSTFYYWSSTESSQTYAYMQISGSQTTRKKSVLYYVRAIRSF